MIDNNLLIEFTNTLQRGHMHTATSLEETLIDNDILNFLNKHNITFDMPIDVLKAGCILGLIKAALKLDIHIIGEKTIASALGMVNGRLGTQFGRYQRWIKSETLYDFFENTLPLLKVIKLHKLKINALTIVDDVAMQSKNRIS